MSIRLRMATMLALAPLVASPGAVAHAAPSPAAVSGPAAPTAATPLGSWAVAALSAGEYRVSWTSLKDFPLRSDRPRIVGVPTELIGPTGVEGRTVSAVVTADTPPDPADLDVLLSGDRLDEPGDDRLARAFRAPASRAAEAQPTTTLSVDPGQRGSYKVTSSNYTLPPVHLLGLPTPVEMIGHVVEPAPGQLDHPAPLVLFEHGRHAVCYRPGHPAAETDVWPCRSPFREIPSQMGYDYVQRLLASQGYVTVSIRANGINAEDRAVDDGGANARAALIRHHLDYWVTMAARHHVDMTRVVLVGHSRGGEGVVRAALQIPLSAPYRIVGQVLIAPTDFASQAAAFIPSVTLLPSCDGDVADLQGQHYVDDSRDLTTGDTALRSAVLLFGANHNYFNTEWTPGIAAAPAIDDWPGPATGGCGRKDPNRLTAAQQRSAGDVYIAGAVRLFAGEQDMLPLFDGSPVRVPSLGKARALTSAIGGGRSTRTPGQATLATAQGADERWCTGLTTPVRGSGYAACGDGLGTTIAPNWPMGGEDSPPARRFLEVDWTAAGQQGGMRWARPLDLSTGRFELRTILPVAATAPRFSVRITDRAGHSAVLQPTVRPVALPSRVLLPKMWAQTTVVDPSPATGVDLTSVVGVDVVGESAHGRLWLADVSAAPSALSAVPARRLPLVDIGQVRVTEGNRGSSAVAKVPVTVHGTLNEQARLLVQYVGHGDSNRQRYTIDVPPGTHRLTIPVVYPVNRVHNLTRATNSYLTIWAISGVMTDRYRGGLTVIDDDPPPHAKSTPRKVQSAGARSVGAR